MEPSLDHLTRQLDKRLTHLEGNAVYRAEDRQRFSDDMMIQIPNALDTNLFSSSDYQLGRLEFLKRLLNRAREYNSMILGQMAHGIGAENWPEVRAKTLSTLRDLKDATLGAQQTVRNR